MRTEIRRAVSALLTGLLLTSMLVSSAQARPDGANDPPYNPAKWEIVINGQVYAQDWDNPLIKANGHVYGFPQISMLAMIGAKRVYYEFSPDKLMIATPTHSVYFTHAGARLDGGWLRDRLYSTYFRDQNPGYSVIPLDSMFYLLGGSVGYDGYGRLNVTIGQPNLTETVAESCAFNGYSTKDCPVDAFFVSDVYRTFGYSRVRESIEHPNFGNGNGMRGLMNKIAIEKQGKPYDANAEWLEIGGELVATYFAFEFGMAVLSQVAWWYNPVTLVEMQHEEAALTAESETVLGGFSDPDGPIIRTRGLPVNSARLQAIETGTESEMQVVSAPPKGSIWGTFRLKEFRWGGYDFDGQSGWSGPGTAPKELLDVKGGDFSSFFSKASGRLYDFVYKSEKGLPGFTKQAEEQIAAAKGVPVTWIWQDERMAQAVRDWWASQGRYDLLQIVFRVSSRSYMTSLTD
jgi:hypothetical protein